MAGYAAVENGASQLGFIGEADKAAVTDYGYGFLQGANDAAANNGVRVNIKYHSCREGGERDAVVKKASEWYEEGVEVIFACGPQVEMPVIESAELNDGKVIACETDKSDMSDTILTSAIKDIGGVINDMLEVYARDKFPGGEVLEYDTSTEIKKINSLYEKATKDNVIYLNCFSNLISKNINTTFIVSPKSICQSYKERYKSFGSPLSLLNQCALTDFLIKNKLSQKGHDFISKFLDIFCEGNVSSGVVTSNKSPAFEFSAITK